jgi:hypothetical protein
VIIILIVGIVLLENHSVVVIIWMIFCRVVCLDLINVHKVLSQQRIQNSGYLKNILDGQAMSISQLNEDFAWCSGSA